MTWMKKRIFDKAKMTMKFDEMQKGECQRLPWQLWVDETDVPIYDGGGY